MYIKNFNMEIAWSYRLITKLKGRINEEKNTHILDPILLGNINGGVGGGGGGNHVPRRRGGRL